MSSGTPYTDKTPTPSVTYTAPTYREDPVDAKVKRKFRGKGASEYYDPCQDAANRSIQCLNRNFGDREMCSDYFQAYRDCKKKWIDERKEDRKKGTGFFAKS
ncbi:cytochrome c oxidase-assembly factor cox-23 [Terfezia boudieri ATCC MYA-4762]|uniref:Cytochrome c oxidase-assembly factor cox-23 n=1 Tax=Terfezia boudieri ATCC MYA-4762 TaxID=1051890 RepID=A0A3N4LQ81_9PEZI|nr:cytochrome c oxidase-assembly factor cox-23 [Terfezia boudieri ATCC MYA-4762]